MVPEDYATEHGDTPEQQYDTLLHSDLVLRQLAPRARRLTPVMAFHNYQSLSRRLCGDNWAMLGDSGGFIDPVFSSGLLIAMDSAYKLAETLLRGNPLAHYERQVQAHLRAWFEVVGYYYDGRLMSSIKRDQSLQGTPHGRLLMSLISPHVTGIFIGAATTHWFSLALLRLLVNPKYGLYGKDPDIYRIH